MFSCFYSCSILLYFTYFIIFFKKNCYFSMLFVFYFFPFIFCGFNLLDLIYFYFLKHNSQTIEFTHWKCTNQWVLYIYKVVQLSSLILEYFHHPKRNHILISNNFPSSSLSSPWQQLIHFLSLYIFSILTFSYKWNPMIYGLLSLAYYT